MLKKFALAVSSISSIFMVACSSDNVAGGTIDPNSIAEASSSSESVPDVNPIVTSSSAGEKNVNVGWSSSSATSMDSVAKSSSSKESVLSSSSVADKGSKDLSSSSTDDKDLVPDPIPVSSSSENIPMSSSNGGIVVANLKDFTLQCQADAVPLKVAYKNPVDAEYLEVTIRDNFRVPCDAAKRDAFVESVNGGTNSVSAFQNDTLVVRVSRNQSESYECSCVADVKFKMDIVYDRIGYTKFDDNETVQIVHQN